MGVTCRGAGVSATLRDGAGSSTGALLSFCIIVVMSSTNACSADLFASVSGAKGERGEGFLRALAMSIRAAKMRSLEELSGIWTLVGNQETVSQVRIARVSKIQMRQHRYDSIAGPTYQPSRPWGDQVVLSLGLAWASTRHPGGPSGVAL
eukprot:scaffold3231_cov111-Cylindrotheca_fusiformis.AAC.1